MKKLLLISALSFTAFSFSQAQLTINPPQSLGVASATSITTSGKAGFGGGVPSQVTGLVYGTFGVTDGSKIQLSGDSTGAYYNFLRYDNATTGFTLLGGYNGVKFGATGAAGSPGTGDGTAAGVTSALFAGIGVAIGNTTDPGAGNLSATGTVKATSFYYTSTVFDSAGSGSPEGVVTAGIGSTYRRTNGGAATSYYVKESGAGNTGWVAK